MELPTAEYEDLIAYIVIVEALVDRSQVDTPPPDGRLTRAAWQRYAEALREEFRAAHLTDGDLGLLYLAAARLSHRSSRVEEVLGNSQDPPAESRS